MVSAILGVLRRFRAADAFGVPSLTRNRYYRKRRGFGEPSGVSRGFLETTTTEGRVNTSPISVRPMPPLEIRRSPRRKILVVALIALAFAAVAIAWQQGLIFRDRFNSAPIAHWAADPLVAAAGNGDRPQIVVVSVKPPKNPAVFNGSYYVEAEAILVNPLKTPVNYSGFPNDGATPLVPGDIRPWYSVWVRYENGATWSGSGQLWWGFGEEMQVRPGQAGRFAVQVRKGLAAAKIGFKCSWEDGNGLAMNEVLWSDEFVPDAR
jgi:hypothetical protein